MPHSPVTRVYTRVMVTHDDVVEALHGVEDPELGMDIVELGLFYDAEIAWPNVKVIHSLTSMGCPAGPMIQENIHDAVAALPGVEHVEVELTFDPPWTPDRMSDDAKFILGFGGRRADPGDRGGRELRPAACPYECGNPPIRAAGEAVPFVR